MQYIQVFLPCHRRIILFFWVALRREVSWPAEPASSARQEPEVATGCRWRGQPAEFHINKGQGNRVGSDEQQFSRENSRRTRRARRTRGVSGDIGPYVIASLSRLAEGHIEKRAGALLVVIVFDNLEKYSQQVTKLCYSPSNTREISVLVTDLAEQYAGIVDVHD